MPRIFLVMAAIAAAIPISIAALAQQPAADESRLPIKEFMGHVLQRNAEQLWRWTAYEIDAKGEHSGKPRSDEEWEQAESDALTLQQLTYVLDHSAYRVADKRWDEHLARLRASATASATAAEHKDFDAMETAGNDLNDQCVACHLTFAPGLEMPFPPS